MQRQQNREYQTEDKPTRRRARRSWGELLAGWLLVLGGIAWISLLLSLAALTTPSQWIKTFPWALPGIVLFLSGGASLARARKLAQWLLMSLVPIALIVAGLFFLYAAWTRSFFDGLVIGGGIFLGFALMLFFLARWLGRQEDIED